MRRSLFSSYINDRYFRNCFGISSLRDFVVVATPASNYKYRYMLDFRIMLSFHKRSHMTICKKKLNLINNSNSCLYN